MSNKELYKQGISFENPTGPLHPLEQRALDLIKFGKIEKNNMWDIRKPLWYDSIRERVNSNLNISNKAIPLYSRLNLGEALPPTAETASTQRNFWGALTNLITTGAEFYTAKEVAKTEQIKSEITIREQIAKSQESTKAQVINYIPWILGISGTAIIGYVLIKKRR